MTKRTTTGKARADALSDSIAEEQALAQRMSAIKHKIVVLSGKGGVGKSTVAVNLAATLAYSGFRVGLLDADIHGPSIPTMMNLTRRNLQMEGDSILPLEVGTLKVMSIGLLLGDNAAPVIWRGPMKAGVIKQFLKDVVWGDLDYLIIDSPPGTGDEPLSVCQLIPSLDGAIVVTTPQEVSLADARRAVSFCQKLQVPVIGVVENMSGFVCSQCGRQEQIFKRGGGERMAREMLVPFLGRIPLDPSIVTAGDAGLPFVQRFPETPAAQAFSEVIRKIVNNETTPLVQSDTSGSTRAYPERAAVGAETAAAESDAPDRFFGRMNDPSAVAVLTGPCGDTMEFYLAIRDDIIEEVKYYTEGCHSTRLCGAAVAARVWNRNIFDALSVSAGEILDALKGSLEQERHCALLAVSAFYRAIADYLLKP